MTWRRADGVAELLAGAAGALAHAEESRRLDVRALGSVEPLSAPRERGPER